MNIEKKRGGKCLQGKCLQLYFREREGIRTEAASAAAAAVVA